MVVDKEKIWRSFKKGTPLDTLCHDKGINRVIAAILECEKEWGGQLFYRVERDAEGCPEAIGLNPQIDLPPQVSRDDLARIDFWLRQMIETGIVAPFPAPISWHLMQKACDVAPE